MDNFSEEYLIYLRKSRKDMEAEARGEGETLARHERTLLELARRQRLNVTSIYREVVSGETIASRPVMQQVLSEVEQGLWAGVLVMEVERLARGDTIDQGIIAQTFKFSDTKIITPLKTYDPNDEYDEEYFEFGLFMSRREYKTINRRLQRGKLASAREGKWTANRAPYGYRRIKLEKEKGWTLEPIEEEAATVRLIYDLYINGMKEADGSVTPMTLGAVARYLDDAGIPSPDGSQWIRSTLNVILSNPAYIGMVRWGHRPSKKKVIDGRIVKRRSVASPEDVKLFNGRHPAIISEEVFSQAAEVRERSIHPPFRTDVNLQNPLAGIIFCSRCGHSMSRKIHPSRPSACSLACQTYGCKTVSSDLALVEERLLQGLAEWMRGYELEWEDAAETQTTISAEVKKKALSRSEGELEKLYKQLDRAHDLLEQGVYDTDTFLSRSRTLSDKISETKASIERYTREIAEAEERETRQRDIIPKIKNLLEAYHSLPSAGEKNTLLKDVVEKVIYTKERVEGQKLAPDGFELDIFPRIPRKKE